MLPGASNGECMQRTELLRSPFPANEIALLTSIDERFRLTVTNNFVNNFLMPSRHVKPTEAELAILRVLWDSGPLSVRNIQGVLSEAKPTGYTTALKMLQIMTEKGLVDRDETVRPQIYRARYSREHTQKQLLTNLLDRAFGGSVRTLVLQALSAKKSSPEDLEAMEKLLDRFELNKPEGGAK